jgi:site-specific DNA-methyltransferase (adenine-specific)
VLVGEPVDVAGARQLAQEDRHQFQYWALSLLEARPEQQKQGADRGVDGALFFLDGPRRASHKAIIQVKSGHVSSPLVRDLEGTVEREGAALGLFITLEQPTREMRTEAASSGFFHSDLMDRDYPRVQIRTVEDLLEGRAFEMPPRPVQFPQAQRVPRREGTQPSLLDRPA